MRANIDFDENNYIVRLVTAYDGMYVLPDDFDLENIYAYKLVNDQIVFDSEKAEEIHLQDEKREHMQILLNQLKESDEALLDFIERLFSLKNPLTFISDMIALMKDYTNLVADRQQIRAELKEL